MYACMYVCVCVHMHAYTYMRILYRCESDDLFVEKGLELLLICMYVCMHVYMYVCMYLCAYVVHVHACIVHTGARIMFQLMRKALSPS